MSGQIVNIGLVLAAGTILVLSLLNDVIRSKVWISEALICLLVGVVAGPVLLGAFKPDIAGQEHVRLLLEQVARVTVSLSVMSAALRLPDGFLKQHWRSIGIVLTLGMLAMWAASTALVWALSGIGILTALIIGAAVTPTDPVLAGSIVRGHAAKTFIEPSTRHAITAESGINDGLALPFVLLPILLLTRPGGEVWGHFLVHVLLWEVIGAAALGLAIGWATGKAFAWADEHRATDRKTVTAVTLALTLTVLAGVRLMGADGILAVFVAGIVFRRFLEEEHEEQSEHFEEAIDRFFTLPVFILFGAALPWAEWQSMSLPIFGVAVLVLLLRRLPAFLALKPLVPLYGSARTAGFVGWFGPIGAAALFYATIAVHRTGDPIIWTVVSAIVAASVLLHGISATPLTRRFGDAEEISRRKEKYDDGSASVHERPIV